VCLAYQICSDLRRILFDGFDDHKLKKKACVVRCVCGVVVGIATVLSDLPSDFNNKKPKIRNSFTVSVKNEHHL
jgi:hypothetical protein